MSYEEETTDLRARIRELEAELVEAKNYAQELIDKQRVRAEKAESLVSDAKKVLANLRSQVLVLMSQNRRSEARVAELKDLIHWALGDGPTDTIAVLFPEKPDDWPRRPFYWRSALRVQFEAREREAE